MKRPLIISLIFAAILAGAFFHFHDGPPPDLSRFTHPAHDPVAFAEVKKLTDEIRANFKEYKIVDPSDPEEYPEDETKDLDKLALQQNPDAVRALRRHIKENEAALAAAHKLIFLEKIAFEPLLPGNAFATRADSIPGMKNAFRLLQRETLLAAIEGRSEPAWAALSEGLRFARRAEKAQTTLIAGLTILAMEGIDLAAANNLAAFEKSPERIRNFLTAMEENRPEPLQFRTSFSVEIFVFADSVLPSRGGKINLRDMSGMRWGIGSTKSTGLMEWLKDAPNNARAAWLGINTLPNDTAYEYGQMMDIELAMTTPTPAKTTPSRSEWGLWLLAKNSGGTVVNRMLRPAFGMVRNQYFRNAAHHDLTRLALAIRAYQLSHDGNRPATLAALAPDILPSLPIDAFDGGAPFRYDPVSGKVWSPGTDGKDDGGDPEKDIVVAPPVLTPPPAAP